MDNFLFHLKMIDLCMTQSPLKRWIYKKELKKLLTLSKQKSISLETLIDLELLDLLGQIPLRRSIFSSFYSKVEFYEKLSELL
ncbi:hypothetical protein D922_02443 [Enterococcus faecalis 06-MB-DW-09]|nr:hypothetical protein D922_02443 [Enterococcus faecalis 06-MB-DW-09]